MAEVTAKGEMKDLIQDAIATATRENIPAEKLLGVALFYPGKDELFLSLKNFAATSTAITEIPNFVIRFGKDNSTRIVLQFIYQYFKRADMIKYDDSIFENLYAGFVTEVQEPNWVFRGVANMRFFQADSLLIDLGDGITIRGRGADDLRSLGFDDAVLERLVDDWSGFGASSYVLVVEDNLPKQPDNLILMHSGLLITKAMRAVQALRLVETGSVGIGRMWARRTAHFNVGMGGLTAVGASIPTIGNYYIWTDEVAQAYPVVYRELTQLEKDGYGKAPGNLEVALRAFMATYDRYPSFLDSQLLDAITALEAILGTGSELSFRLAFRVAGLLAASDEERGTLLKAMKEFYDTRSTVVHGGRLSEKHRRCLGKVEELRTILRRLLRSFVFVAVNPPRGYHRSFFANQLDITLVDGEEREKLRTALNII